jgi:hypothetical protein
MPTPPKTMKIRLDSITPFSHGPRMWTMARKPHPQGLIDSKFPGVWKLNKMRWIWLLGLRMFSVLAWKSPFRAEKPIQWLRQDLNVDGPSRYLFLFSVYLTVEYVPQVRCILCRRASTLGITCLVIEVLHTLPRNLGSKMKPFVITSCLELPMRRSDIRKVQPLFNSRGDNWRCSLVLHQCALEQDLMLFEAGDRTEVGEKGLTLRYVIKFIMTGFRCRLLLW